MVQRFTPLLQAENERYLVHVKADIAWCNTNQVDYLPCVYPGFSWYNLGKTEFGGMPPLGQIPRQKGKFYWDQISTAVKAGASRLYVAMFDEIDEGTAIFKCTNTPPSGSFKLLDYEGMPTDHYLWLTGKAGEMLRGELPYTTKMPVRTTK
ncbi:MAG: xylosidase [Mucilaginibacter sp.]|nr:xylosidase [Mucilaginibacter sp.]